jgi:hypothetical protein
VVGKSGVIDLVAAHAQLILAIVGASAESVLAVGLQVDVDGVPSIFLLEQPASTIPPSLAGILREHLTSAGSNRPWLLTGV